SAAVMSTYYVFVRFFINYSESFPFDRVAPVKDEQVENALEVLGQEWLAKPENRQTLENWRKDFVERVKKHHGSIIEPGSYHAFPVSAPKVVSGAQIKVPGEIPEFEDVAAHAGWGRPANSDAFPHGISRRHPLGIIASKEVAENLVA